VNPVHVSLLTYGKEATGTIEPRMNSRSSSGDHLVEIPSIWENLDLRRERCINHPKNLALRCSERALEY
jgi:hypothetical protein